MGRSVCFLFKIHVKMRVCTYIHIHIYRHVQAATVADVAAVQGGAASGSQPASSTPVANESEPAAAPC